MSTASVPEERASLTDLAPDVELLQGRRAGFVTRALAYVIDAAIVVAGVPVMMYGIAVVIGLARLETPTYPPDIPDWVPAALSALWTFWYFVGSWCASGRTVGAIVMGIRVVGRRKERVGLVAATIRFWVLVATLLGVAELWLLLSKSRLALHDRAARTQVIYDSASKRQEVRVALRAEGSDRQAK